jgi:radical SAM family uncharacterized protein
MNFKDVEKILLEVEKPARYIGIELGSVIKDKSKIDLRFAFCFPDTYEIGMSHLGMKILYGLLNSIEYVWCERSFAPWVDMDKKMREKNIPLFALESKDPLYKFDIIGFTLQYELSFTNVLNMLSLSRIPLESKDRKGLENLVIAGGPCTCNPEPMADFVDVFFIGEAEENLPQFISLYREFKQKGKSKEEFLKQACKIDGIYVPKFYSVNYNAKGQIDEVSAEEYAPKKVKKAIVLNMDKSYYPKNSIVPMIEVVHDRVEGEIFRGCIRGCRFCQAGFIYRPVREKSVETINDQCKILCQNTGHEEISLCSLSSSDYSEIEELLQSMNSWTDKKKISISLPSLRINSFSDDLKDKLKSVRRSGLTFAPEAGSQRLRDVINKNVTKQEILNTCNAAFSGGWTSLKLYFMIGLPTETDDDIEAISDLAHEIVNLYYSNKNRKKGGFLRVTISAASFVPKPFTPFQWEGQNTINQLKEKQELLKTLTKSKSIKCNYHDSDTSFIEAVFALGDRRLSRVLKLAHNSGLKFDSWSECFSLKKWLAVFKELNIDPEFYANRKRSFNEILPWDHLDYGINKQFLIDECKKAYDNVTTSNCRESCQNCGAMEWKGGICIAKR